MTQQPRTVRRAVQLLAALVLLGAATAVLTAVLREDLIDAWTAGHPVDSDIQEPSFVPVAVVLFLTFAGLVWVLVPFLRAGAAWARMSLVIIVVLVAFATLAGLRTDPPAAFVVAAALSLVLDAALVFFLCHPRTTAYVRGTAEPVDSGV